MTKLVISIINYRTAELTCAVLQSILDDLGDLDAVVIVVDNASGDRSADQIESWMKQSGDRRLRLICSEENTGFSGGHNQSFAAQDADYYLVLNSDGLVRPGFFKTLNSGSENHGSINWKTTPLKTSN